MRRIYDANLLIFLSCSRFPLPDANPHIQIRNTPGEGPWTRSQYAPFFETAIRYLGGLLAAYALSGESILLDRASDLATLLEPAFNTPEGLPRFGVNTNTSVVSSALFLS